MQLLDPEREAALVGLNRQHHGLHAVTLLEHF
jgi:hypothetical protein